MLAETLTEWTENWKAEGLAKGRIEGLQEGLEKGRMEEKCQMIKRLYSVNMKPDEAKFIYRWSQPGTPYYDGKFEQDGYDGTHVQVVEY